MATQGRYGRTAYPGTGAGTGATATAGGAPGQNPTGSPVSAVAASRTNYRGAGEGATNSPARPQVAGTGRTMPTGTGGAGGASLAGQTRNVRPARPTNPNAPNTGNPNTVSVGSPTTQNPQNPQNMQVPGTRPMRTATGGQNLPPPENSSHSAGSRIASSTRPAGSLAQNRGAAASTSSALGRTLPSRTSNIGRRPSNLVVEKEKKTDYWQDVAQVASQQGAKLSGDELHSVISRAMSLGIVGDKKQRESVSGPKAQELLGKMKETMEQRLVELNNGKPVNVDALTSQNATLMDKIMGLEKTLATLETKKQSEESEDKLRLQNKIVELERSLKSLEETKKEQREQNRRTMKLEIANLKEMMTKVQTQKETETSATAEAKQMSAKMNRLEAALRLMNEERKKGQVDDKETILLRRKLTLFEQKLKEMEEEKKIKEQADQSGQLRDKLLLMEDKLEKMERRKSMSTTVMMQQKMDAVEKQLSMLRSVQGGGAGGGKGGDEMANKMALLERQLKELAAQKAAAPKMVNDEETVNMRGHIKKLEDILLSTEKRMEEQRIRIEEERKQMYEKRQIEEDEKRRLAREKEAEMVNRIKLLEDKLRNQPAGSGGGSNIDTRDLHERIDKLALSGGDPAIGAKLAAMEAQLAATQRALQEEQSITAAFFNSKPTEGPALEKWQTEAQLAWLNQTNKALMEKLAATNSLIDSKLQQFSSFQFTGGGGGGAVQKSGLSYDEINKKLQEIQAQLFDENIEQQESERLNIEYEKLITELESTPEYQKEQDLIKAKWKTENLPLNKASFDKVFGFLSTIPDTKQAQVLKRKPELRLLLRAPDAIMKLHANDFKQLSTQNLNLDEARALYHNMPNFRKDQEQQFQWVEQLKLKIEVEVAKPPKKAPPPIAAKKKVVIKKKQGGGTGGASSFLDELLHKRKKRD